MSRLTVGLRTVACLLWFVGGVITGGIVGLMSAIASLLFLIAMRLESAGYEDKF